MLAVLFVISHIHTVTVLESSCDVEALSCSELGGSRGNEATFLVFTASMPSSQVAASSSIAHMP